MSGDTPEVTVRVPGLLARFTDGERTVTLRAGTVDDCMDRLVAEYPAIESHLFDGRGNLRTHVQLFVDDENVEWLEGPDAPLSEGSTVTVLQAVSGGEVA